MEPQLYLGGDPWLQIGVMKDRFSLLFELSDNKMAIASEMRHLVWGEGGEAWKWYMRLWAWEEDLLRECSVLLNSIILQDDVNDRWLWILHTSKNIQLVVLTNCYYQETNNSLKMIIVFFGIKMLL